MQENERNNREAVQKATKRTKNKKQTNKKEKVTKREVKIRVNTKLRSKAETFLGIPTEFLQVDTLKRTKMIFALPAIQYRLGLRTDSMDK